jgi:hypothetical protein
VWLLPLLVLGTVPIQQPSQCYALTYDSLSEHARPEDFPATVRLGRGTTTYRHLSAAQDLGGRWGTPLDWNTYRLRGDSIVVWLADGNREIKIAGRVVGEALDASIALYFDEAGIRLMAHLTGRLTSCGVQ